MAALSLSSWAVHDWISDTFEFFPGQLPPTGVLDRLLFLPAQAASMGFSALEVCDFHLLPDRLQLERFRASASEAGIEPFQLLIDHGDITHPTESVASLDYIEGWIRLAAAGGFSRVRVIAGQQPPSPSVIDKAVEGLLRLKAVGDSEGIGVSTENWLAMMVTPDVVVEVLERTGLGLVFDFGNWSGPEKLPNLAKIAPYATSAHAKCHYANGQPLLDDFDACLRLAKEHGFDGKLTLVHPEQPDEWTALEAQINAVRSVFSV